MPSKNAIGYRLAPRTLVAMMICACGSSGTEPAVAPRRPPLLGTYSVADLSGAFTLTFTITLEDSTGAAGHPPSSRRGDGEGTMTVTASGTEYRGLACTIGLLAGELVGWVGGDRASLSCAPPNGTPVPRYPVVAVVGTAKDMRMPDSLDAPASVILGAPPITASDYTLRIVRR